MHVRFLGTGAAGGWPNPYCACPSCQAERAAGRSRSSTCILVDECVLLDAGPAALDGARTLNQSLAAVEHVIITHGHADHLSPEFLLYRHWATDSPHGRPLHLWAPPTALASCRAWIAPDDLLERVQLHPLHPGDHHRCITNRGSYRLHVLPSAHSPAGTGDGEVAAIDPLAAEAVLIDLEDDDGVRLLYATDTGPLPAEAIAMTRGRHYTLACIEQTFGHYTDHATGHLDLRTFPQVMSQLRNVEAVTDTTQVIAVHLGHHNPPTPRLSAILEPIGVQIVDDGTELMLRPGVDAPSASTSKTSTSKTSTSKTSTSAGGVSIARSHLVLGGARSGKSRFAERLATDFADVVYVACARTSLDDAEWSRRIQEHRGRRPTHWVTVETSEVASVIAASEGGRSDQPPASCVLVDCLGTWVTGLVDDASAWDDRDLANRVVSDACSHLLSALRATSCAVILVSNEVGSGVVPGTPSGRLFRDLLGTVNLRIAENCDAVTLMVAGHPMPLVIAEVP